MASKEAVKKINTITRKQNLTIDREDVKIIISKSGAGYSVFYRTETGREKLGREGRQGVLKMIDAGIGEGANFSNQPTGYKGDD